MLGVVAVRKDCWLLDVSHFTPIKAKTPVIVHDQGKSRQTPKSQIPVCLANPPAGWVGRAAERSNHAPRRNPLPGGEETGEGERPTKLSGRVIMPAAANQGKNPSNQGSSCLIKAYQGIRQKTCHSNFLQSSAIGRRSVLVPSSLRLRRALALKTWVLR